MRCRSGFFAVHRLVAAIGADRGCDGSHNARPHARDAADGRGCRGGAGRHSAHAHACASGNDGCGDAEPRTYVRTDRGAGTDAHGQTDCDAQAEGRVHAQANRDAKSENHGYAQTNRDAQTVRNTKPRARANARADRRRGGTGEYSNRQRN